MSTAERMTQKLAETPHWLQGTPCRHCGTTALACQHGFVITGEWCCPECRRDGGRLAHTAEAGDA